MNFKRSTMAIVLMALSLISMASIQQDAFAQSRGMSIEATADKGSDTITVMGTTSSGYTDVGFLVTAPNGNKVFIGQETPDENGNFGIELKVSNWKEDGYYTILAKQGQGIFSLSVDVLVNNGMTEKTSETQSTLDTGSILPKVTTRDAGIEIYAEADLGSDIITITGMTDRVSTDITLTVTAPNGNRVHLAQVSPSLEGEFTSVITLGGPLWKEDGFYTVKVQQFNDPKYIASTEVDIKDGVVVPEFGTIAAMILAVAIISIIAISAKSRLSIIPRY